MVVIRKLTILLLGSMSKLFIKKSGGVPLLSDFKHGRESKLLPFKKMLFVLKQ